MEKIRSAFAWLNHSKWRYLILWVIFVLYLYAYFMIFCDVPELPTTYTAYRNEAAGKWALALLLVQYALGLSFLFFQLFRHHCTVRTFVDVALFLGINSMVYYGFALTVGTSRYDFRNDWWVNQSGSHWTIVYEIFTTGKIPDPPLTTSGSYNLDNQYYQSKLWHLIAGYFARFNYLFLSASDEVMSVYAAKGYSGMTYHVELAFESIKILQAALGYWLYVLSYEIFRHLKLEGRSLGIATALMVLLPFYAYIPFVYNNDTLMLAFTLGALLMALRYRDAPTYGRAMLCALLLGLGMMSKINAGFAAFPIAFLFLNSFLELRKRGTQEEQKTFVFQMLVFALIVFPIGLFHSFYAYFKYGESFTYVLYPGNEYSSNYVSVSFYGVYNRFIGLFTSDLWVRPYKYDFGRGGLGRDEFGYIDFNIWTGLFKTALFGNAVFSDAALVDLLPFNLINAHARFIFNLWFILCVFGLASVVSTFVLHCRAHWQDFTREEAFLLVIGVVTLADYFYFCAKFPFTSTMHFRYASLLIFPFFYCLAKHFARGWNHLEENNQSVAKEFQAFARA